MACGKHPLSQTRMQTLFDKGQGLFHPIASLAVFHLPTQVGMYIEPVFVILRIQIIQPVLQALKRITEQGDGSGRQGCPQINALLVDTPIRVTTAQITRCS